MKWVWNKKYVKGFTKKVTVVERQHWLEYLPAFVIITCIVAIVWMWVKIYQLWAIERWLKSF